MPYNESTMANPVDDFKKGIAFVIAECKREIGGVRANRPSPSLVEDIKVSYYGETMPLKHVGSITVSPPRELTIQLWDAGAVPAVSKAIETSSLGLTANVDGTTIRIFLPELSVERRDELAKHVKKIAEQYRIQVRHHRDAANKSIEVQLGAHEISEDQKFRLRDEVQKITDNANKEIEGTVSAKVREIEE